MYVRDGCRQQIPVYARIGTGTYLVPCNAAAATAVCANDYEKERLECVFF